METKRKPAEELTTAEEMFERLEEIDRINSYHIGKSGWTLEDRTEWDKRASERTIINQKLYEMGLRPIP